MIVHGGDLAAVARAYGVDAAQLIDFSANVSPYGPPPGVAKVLRAAADAPRTLSPYPSPEYAALRSMLARKEGVEAAQIVVGHGASALIEAAVREARAPAWVVPVPAFGEYRRAIESAGSAMLAFPLESDFDLDSGAFVRNLLDTPGAGVLLNVPHNPSGRGWSLAALRAILDACARTGRAFVIDEAFVDYDPAGSFAIEAIAYARSVVIRSLTKFYAIAGVRVGFAIASTVRAAALRAATPSWPVGTLDVAIAREALADETYARRTREQNGRERAWLADALASIGIRTLPSAANFLLIDLGRPVRVMNGFLRRMAERGIAVRDCRSFERLEQRAFIRIAVLARPENERLVETLEAVLRAEAP